jgi:hypothetical protein
MPKLFNTITKKWQNVGPSDVNSPIFATTDGTEVPVIEAVVGYKSPAIDADGDGFIQDGTPFERPVGTELTLEEQIAAVTDTPKPKKARKSNK